MKERKKSIEDLLTMSMCIDSWSLCLVASSFGSKTQSLLSLIVEMQVVGGAEHMVAKRSYDPYPVSACMLHALLLAFSLISTLRCQLSRAALFLRLLLL